MRDHDRPRTKHLIAIAIGPVQDFIAQARRTRDLWFGSHLLSEIAKAAAAALASQRCELIFPALTGNDAALRATETPLDDQGRPSLSVANRILAIVPDERIPREAATLAREAATRHLFDMAAAVRERWRTHIADGCEEDWREQLATFLEFTACWAPLTSDAAYPQVRVQVERQLAARKTLREFRPWKVQRARVPKSSLDGARTTVLRRGDSHPRGLRLSSGEQLDAIGLLKRGGGRPEPFVPLPTIALANWMRAARARRPLAWQRLGDASQGLSPVKPRLPWLEKIAFPYDAELFLPGRLEAVCDEAGLAAPNRAALAAALDEVTRGMQEPFPYAACIVADGDRMGEALASIGEADERVPPWKAHQRFSRALADFPSQVRRTLEEGELRGVLVYSGGDDVLAFVCLQDALAAANAMSRLFGEVLLAALPGEAWDGRRPTLSVGIGVAHVLDGMGRLLGLARKAERLAKHPDRNGLAIVLEKRAGQRLEWRGRWPEDPVRRLTDDMTNLSNGVPSHGKLHEIHQTLIRLPASEAELPPDSDRAFARLLDRESTRTLARSASRTAEDRVVTPADVGLDLTAVHYREQRRSVETWMQRMLLATELHRAVVGDVP